MVQTSALEPQPSRRGEGSPLAHLLKTEAKAAALVNEAQEEADRRIQENEEKNKKYYEEQIKIETDKRKVMLENEKQKTSEAYQKELDNYKNEISKVNVNQQKISDLMNKLIGEG